MSNRTRPAAAGVRGRRLAAGLLLAASAGLAPLVADGRPSVILTSPAQRAAYLARAVVWEPRGVPTPAEIVEGPPRADGVTRAQANPASGIPCAWQSGGAQMGGKTPKFTCRTPDGATLRVKYFDDSPQTGNREVFAEVVSTRLFWALGFSADSVYPITVDCTNCPANPMTGSGPPIRRTFLGVTETPFVGVPILSAPDVDQGWKFGEFDSALARLPAGPDKEARIASFDAMRLLASFVQHGDRKPSQQRLTCTDGPAEGAGTLRALGGAGATSKLVALAEPAGTSSCKATLATVQDLGATLGASGLFSTRSAKITLTAWASRPVFAPQIAERGFELAPCRVDITSSASAGRNAVVARPVTDVGRRLLADRLAQLTDAHIRALFEAARVEALGEASSWRDPQTGAVHQGIDAWVAVFKHKRDEVAQTRCPH